MTRLYSIEEVVEFLTSNCPEHGMALIYSTSEMAEEAFEGYVEHMTAGGYPIGTEVET